MTAIQENTPFRVLHVINSGQRRGAEIFAVQLMRNISNARFENAICILDASEPNSLPLNGLTSYRLEIPRRKGLSEVQRIRRMLSAVNEFKPDILLAHGSRTLQFGVVASLFNSVPVSIYRNIGTASFWVKDRVRLEINRILIRRFQAIVSLSSLAKKDFLNLYGITENKITIIPNGVDTHPYRERNSDEVSLFRSELGLKSNDFVITTVGRLSPEKNQCQLIKLMRDFAAEGVEAKLVVVGDGPLRGNLINEAQKQGVFDSIRFLGERDDVPRILKASNLFLLPSRTESMPAVLSEAGLAGLPSVAYDVGAVREMVKDQVSGIIVPSGDYLKFKHATQSLIRSPNKRISMGEAARERCQELFDIKKIALQYEELFLKLLDAPSFAA